MNLPHTLLRVSLFALFTACQSQADIMAEFCLGMDQDVQTSSQCDDMAQRINTRLKNAKSIRDNKVCQSSTACLPCKHAIREILAQCGYTPEIKPLLEQMHFSTTLRESITATEKTP